MSDSSGDCYRASASAIVRPQVRVRDGIYVPSVECFLVQGYPRLTRDHLGHPVGTKFGHAWLEFRWNGHWFCLDTENHILCPREVFYSVGLIDPDECYRLTREEVMRHIVETEVYADWNPNPPEDVVYGSP